MARTRYRSDPTAAVILLTILAAIVFYLFSIPEVTRQDILGEVSTYNNTWLSAQPGEIVADASTMDFKEINIATTSVSNVLTAESVLLSNQFTTSAGVYSTDPETLSFNIDSLAEVSTANIAFTVSSKSGDGALTVSVNGRDIYSSEPALAERVSIEIPPNVLHSGPNTVIFSVEGPGLKFWQRNEYLLTAANAELEVFGASTANIEHSFSLSGDEASNADGAELTMFSRQNSPGNLEVEMNGDLLFRGIPSPTFQLDVPVESIRSGQNTISFSVSEGGAYDLSFITLRVDTETVEGGSNYFFSIDSRDWSRVRSGEFTCELLIRKTSGADTVVAKLNAFSRSYTFVDGEVEADVCDQLEEGSNKLTLSASEDLDLTLVRVGIKP